MPTLVTSEIVLEDIDKGYEELKRQLASMAGVRVETGLFGTEAQKGAWAEFGTEDPETGEERTPPRPWLSVAADQGVNVLASALADAVDEVADGASPQTAFEEYGETAADVARSVLGTSNVGGPRLAESTERRKGSSAKLVDEGTMKRAIKSKVKTRK
jgi:hypothetical protein